MTVYEREIADKCVAWAYKTYGVDFTFRPNQLEAITTIICNALQDGSKTQVLEAPTGSGKSIIAFTVAGVLWDYFNKKSYILASDVGLFDQYEQDLKKYKLDWGCLKGKDNYICQRNGKTINGSECKMNNISISSLSDDSFAISKGYGCAKTCKYRVARELALKAPIVITTYTLFFIYRMLRADISAGVKEVFYKEKFLTICDEAHKLPEIVQNHFSPTIDLDNIAYLQVIKLACEEIGEDVPGLDAFIAAAKVINNVTENAHIMVCVQRYFYLLNCYSSKVQALRDYFKKSNSDNSKLYNAIEVLEQELQSFVLYIGIIEDLGIDAVVCSISDDQNKYVLQCAFENKLIEKSFHKLTTKSLLMSATIGDIDVYKDSIGLSMASDKEFKPIEIPSSFDFSRSPIKYNTKYRMSYREKAASLPHLITQVIDICKAHKNERGIIQTGNYGITKELVAKLPSDIRSRVFFYNGSKDKKDAIKYYLASQNGILVGPSLIEGLNFDGDKCRYIICMKIPYAPLTDKLVKAKMNLIDGWYQNDVCNKLEQGVGRGIRYDGDWCETYILDGCFADLLKYSSHALTPAFKSRLVNILTIEK